MAGTIKKELPVFVDNISDIKLINFKDLSSKTKQNLLTLAQLYNIKWYEIKKYPVISKNSYIQRERYGYIVRGKMGQLEHNVTYLRKVLYSNKTGATELWFGKGFKLSATKIIRSHETYPKSIEYWGKSFKIEPLIKWEKITGREEPLLSYKVSQFVFGNQEKATMKLKYRKEIFDYIIGLAKVLGQDEFMKLIQELHKIQLERF
jgi:hypothetical protein